MLITYRRSLKVGYNVKGIAEIRENRIWRREIRGKRWFYNGWWYQLITKLYCLEVWGYRNTWYIKESLFNAWEYFRIF